MFFLGLLFRNIVKNVNTVSMECSSHVFIKGSYTYIGLLSIIETCHCITQALKGRGC